METARCGGRRGHRAEPERGSGGGVETTGGGEALGLLERHHSARRRGPEDSVGAAPNVQPGSHQRTLQRGDTSAVLVVDGEPRRRGATACRLGGRRRVGGRRQVEQASGRLVHDTCGRHPVRLLGLDEHGAGSGAEHAIGAAGERPAHAHEGPLQGLHGGAAHPRAQPDDRCARRRGRCCRRRGCRGRSGGSRRGAAERGQRLLIDDAGRQQTLRLLELRDGPHGRRAVDPVGAAGDGDPRGDERALHVGDLGAAGALGDRPGGCGCGRATRRLQRLQRGRVDGACDREALRLLEALDGAGGHRPVDAVDPAADALAGVDEQLLELLDGVAGGADGEDGAAAAGRGGGHGRAARRGGEAEGGGRGGVDDAGDGQALVVLERLDGRLGRRAEVAVDAVLDPDADPVQRFLEGTDVVAVGTLLQTDDVRRRVGRGGRHGRSGRDDRRAAQDEPGDDHHGSSAAAAEPGRTGTTGGGRD